MTAFKRTQAKYVKKSYMTTNGPEYEAALRQRGSLTVWISEDELKTWGRPRAGRRKPGGQVQYSDQAIETALTVGMVFHLALRQTEGFLRSLFSLLGVDWRAPDHTTIWRRARKLGKLPVCSAAGNKPVHILVDSTGLKVHVGNLRKPPKSRDWRKLHVSVNAVPAGYRVQYFNRLRPHQGIGQRIPVSTSRKTCRVAAVRPGLHEGLQRASGRRR